MGTEFRSLDPQGASQAFQGETTAGGGMVGRGGEKIVFHEPWLNQSGNYSLNTKIEFYLLEA